MCGCGEFFCRKCSPSTVFCPRCLEQRRRLEQARSHEVLVAAPAGAGHVATPHGHLSLPRRLLLEALVTLMAAIAFLGGMVYLQNRSYAFEPSHVISYGIDAGQEPEQESIRPFQETIWVNGTRAQISGDTAYVINARVQGTRAYHDAVGDVVPYDFLLAWGRMADEDISSKLNWSQADRRGQVSGVIGGATGPDVSSDYVATHVSNNHLIPADESIRAALAQVKPGDMVRISGRLVDVRVFTGEGQAMVMTTSKSRYDQGDGACEVIYVESIRINGKTF